MHDDRDDLLDLYGIREDDVDAPILGPDEDDPHDGISGSRVPLRSVEAIAAKNGMTEDEVVTWALRKMGTAGARLDEISALAAAERDRISRFVEEASRQPKATVDRFDGLLRDYVARKNETDPKVKTMTFPTGKLTARKSPDRIEVDEVEEFLRWCKRSALLGRFFSVEFSPKKRDLLAAVEPAGSGLVYDEETRVVREGVVLSSSDVFVNAETGEPLDDVEHLDRVPEWAAILPIPADVEDEEDPVRYVVPGIAYVEGVPVPKAVPSGPIPVAPAP